MIPSQEHVQHRLRYEPESGRFFWLNPNPRAYSICVGDETGLAKDSYGYGLIGLDGTNYLAHRLAWLHVYGEWPPELDHIDGDRSNNRITNLRKASRQQQARNRARRCNQKYLKGVRDSGAPNFKYVAKIWDGSKDICLGYFRTEAEAHEAYRRAAIERFGLFACDGERR